MLVPLELKCKEPDGDRVVYTGTYDTEGVAPTKSGERQPIQITMPVRLGWGLGSVFQGKWKPWEEKQHICKERCVGINCCGSQMYHPSWISVGVTSCWRNNYVINVLL